ncbi:MAG: 1-acyl-sn-glycerol-3-phosphate acyltransferase [Desulfobacteraceae bacterium]|nr:MAG: 1-acyl-sn-glycerol-3-phosphate acyltransferase [Desulfobacteraceae bacterium]
MTSDRSAPASLINTFFSWFLLAFIGITSILFFIPALIIWALTVLFDRRLIALSMYSAFWGSVYTWCVPIWNVTIIGREKMDMKKHYMIVSNHQSQLDILVAYRLMYPFRWVSKAEVFRLPFIGWNMMLNRHVRIKRGDKQSREQMMKDCESALAERASLYFFPEGTRSSSGIMKPFKPGAFILAHKMKTPILPVVINGTKDALPKHSLTITGIRTMTLTVLDEIPYEAFKDLSIDQTAQMAFDTISRHVREHAEQGSDPADSRGIDPLESAAPGRTSPHGR